MSAQHTPGPYSFMPEAHDEDGEPLFFSIYAPNGKEIAVTANGNYPTEVEEAHARLLAAAPELLTALTAVLDEMYMPSQHDGDQSDWNCEAEPQFIAARAAIAKATQP